MAQPHAHAHRISVEADRRRLRVALALIPGFVAVEVVVGILASSLALLGVERAPTGTSSPTCWRSSSPRSRAW